jgi:class 3 adenylate cyclase/tetratricopeptide (TPR) repeat protein
MHCSRCQHENPSEARFCLDCGGRLVIPCAGCGTELPGGARFCLHCGQPVTVAPVQGAPPDPRSYTPRHLAEKILTSRAALEGERKQVTVLFADVKGSMELTEQMDPEDWHGIMDRFFHILADGVHRFEGTVNQYTGDGIMALFGAPIAHEDHAQRACYAALHLQHELRRYADEVRLAHGLGFSVRMGLNSGEVVVGKIGDDLRMDYTAQGHTVGLAARMEQMADPGKALLTGHTARLVSGYFQLRDLGETRIKGLSDLLRVFELEGVGRMRTRLEVSHARGFSRFVGRQSEMAALEAALEQASAGNAQVVGVVAEPGTGKSRLCYEFAERCRAREIPVYEAHGVAHGKAVPLLPVLEFWRGYFGITEHDTARAARDKIAGRMLLLDETLAEGLPLMFDFLGVPDPERPAPPLGPEARQGHFFSLIRRLARARSAREPAVVLFEDLHWLDRASEEFVENVVEIVPGNRTLMLVNFRPEYHAAWMQRSYYQQLPLLPLGPEATKELLADLLGSDPSLRDLTERVQERTGGNPFFIEEMAQSLVETGAVAGTRGAYRLGTATAEVALPATVQSVLAARIDRLPEREKQVLQTASVIGKKFSEPILRRVADVGDGDLVGALHALTNAEFLYQEALYPEAEYTFKHPLTQEVAYRSQLTERRARVHAAVARTIEDIESGKLGERAALLAYHWECAGDALEATKWHRRAAEWVGFNNSAEALRHWGSVRRLLDTLPETTENLTERATVRAQIMTHLARMGDVEDQATSLFREGRELATRSGDPHVLSQVLYGFGYLRLYSVGAVVEALDPLREAIRRADETDDKGLRVAVRYGLANAYFQTAQLREFLATLEEGLRLAQGDLGLGADRIGFSPSLGLSSFHGVALSLTGRPRDGAAELDRVIERARTSQQLMPLYLAHVFHVIRCEVLGEAAPALAHAREAVNYAERMGSQFSRVFAYLNLGLANVLNRAWHDALEPLEQALAIGRERRLLVVEGRVLAVMAAAHLGLDDRARARGLAEEALTVCRRRGTPLWEFSALVTKIRVLRETLGLQATGEIEAALAEAEAWLERSGAKSYAPFFHVERAELARLTGDDASRDSELRQAHRLFTEMGATGQAERLASELST